MSNKKKINWISDVKREVQREDEYVRNSNGAAI